MAQNRELPDLSNAGEMVTSVGKVLSPELEAYQAYASAIHPLLRPTLLAIGDSARLAEGRTIPGVGRVVEDHHLAGDPSFEDWGQRGTVRELEVDLEQAKGEKLDYIGDGSKAPSDFVDAESYTSGWGKGSETAVRLEAEERARVRKQLIEALREKREANLEAQKEHVILAPKI